jgi:hypothetical protein
VLPEAVPVAFDGVEIRSRVGHVGSEGRCHASTSVQSGPSPDRRRCAVDAQGSQPDHQHGSEQRGRAEVLVG